MQITNPSQKRLRKLKARANEACRNQDYETANRLLLEYVEYVPNDPKALFNLGALRQPLIANETNPVRIHQLRVEAIEFYARAIESPQPDSLTKSDCCNNSGLIMGAIGYPDKAKIFFHLALQLNPENRAARLNYADILVHEGEYEEADRQFFEIINSDPNSAGAQFSRSMILLLMGDIRRGFQEYRARFSVRSCKSKILQTEKPLWEGEPLDGKTLILTLEQGFGDQFQFIRYAELIKTAWPTARVWFSCAGCLHSVLAGCKGLDGCLPDHMTEEFKALCPPFDYHLPLLHLPDVFRTSLETIPANVPYIVPHPDWKQLVLAPTEKKKIGFVWAGSPTHGKDKFRSMSPEQFQRFIDAAPDCQFYSLQCGPRAHEVLQMRNCVDLAQHITDWTQTADVLRQLDLLISVDTAVAHLAGAMAVPVWILIPSSPDWRWMQCRSDSPWYPTAKLYRQPAKGDWESVINQVISDL